MELTDERQLLAIATEVAHEGAHELMGRFGRTAEGVHAKSTPTDLVSEADVDSEKVIRAALQRFRPGDGILAEEGGESGGKESGRGELRWIVDPLDGTVNFLFGIPAFAVSIACEDADGTVVGVVLDPVREECFAATRSGAATLNGAEIDRPQRADLSRAMVATGFGYDATVRERQAAVVTRVLPRVRDIRRFGSAALDLAWCACGRWDAYYERGVHAWDVAAGALIAARAGLEVLDLAATDDDPAGLVVAPAAIVDDLYELVAG